MDETNRGGSFAAELSSRCQTTEAAGSFALSVMKTRPVAVAAHIVPVLLGARSIAARALPARSVPNAVDGSTAFGAVRSRRPGAPSRTKSPQDGSLNAVVNSEQFASRYDWGPP